MVERYKPPTKGEVIPYPSRQRKSARNLVNNDKSDGRGKPLAPRCERIKLAQACQDYTPRALELLKEMLEAKKTSESVKLRCIEVIFERGYGRVAQAEREQPLGGMLVTPEQLQRLTTDERYTLELLVTKLLGMVGLAPQDPSDSTLGERERERIAAEFEESLN